MVNYGLENQRIGLSFVAEGGVSSLTMYLERFCGPAPCPLYSRDSLRGGKLHLTTRLHLVQIVRNTFSDISIPVGILRSCSFTYKVLRRIYSLFQASFLRERSYVSLSKFQYLLFSLRSSCSCLHFLPCLPVSSVFSSVTCSICAQYIYAS